MFTDYSSQFTFPIDLSHGSGFQRGYFQALLQAKALQNKKTVYTRGIEGFTVGTVEDIWTALHEVIPTLHPLTRNYDTIKKSYTNQISDAGDDWECDNGESYRIWDDGYLVLDTYEDGSVMVTIGTLDDEIAQTVIKTVDPLLAADTGHAKISVIVNGSHGPMLMNVGEGGNPFIPENYPPDAVAVFNHVVHDLAAEHPCGRLTILTGLPGCGKTYFVEGLIEKQQHCRYIILPPSVIMNVAAPDLLKVLLPPDGGIPKGPGRLKNGTSERRRIPTVLIIEDADEVLASRGLDNLAAISSILNLADGILGRALDVRVIATSNIKIKEVDKALLRDGRLCRSHDFTELSAEQSQAIYEREVKRLGGVVTGTLEDVTVPSKQVGFFIAPTTKARTLAEIYRTAKEAANH